MKNKLIIVLIIVIMIIITIFYFVKSNIYNNFFVDYDLEINNCVNDNNCDINTSNTYNMISTKYKNKKIVSLINKINSETKNKYSKELKSKTSKYTECSSVVNKYKYRYTSSLDYNIYENKKYISISIIRYNSDVCLNKQNIEQPTVYLYSKNDNKLLTQNEFKKKEKIKDEDVNDVIKRNVTYTNDIDGEQFIYENTIDKVHDRKIYYQSDGAMSVFYFQKENQTYYSAEF